MFVKNKIIGTQIKQNLLNPTLMLEKTLRNKGARLGWKPADQHERLTMKNLVGKIVPASNDSVNAPIFVL